MGQRSPETPWRQGHVLSVEAAKQLDLVHAEAGDDPVVIIISHDCDLVAPSETEPDCEVIPERHIETPDGNLTNAKNPRKLHLPFSGGTVPIIAEFTLIDKRKIRKEELFKYDPSENVRLSRAEFSVLQNWLAARYRRPSFADNFVSRFMQRKLSAAFIKIINRTSTHLLAVLFDVDEGEEIERTDPEDAYSLSVHLVFNVSEDPSEAEIAAKQAAAEIASLFKKACFIKGKWQNIELRECEAISEGTMSLYEARLYKQWQLDYLSLREDPQGRTLGSATAG